MKKFILIIFCLGSFAAFSQVSKVRDRDVVEKKISPNGYEYREYKNDPLKSRWYLLNNGLTVILSPNKTTPRIQTLIATKAGSKSDPADNTGLAHYLEHLLFKGTDKYGTLDFAKEKVYLDQIDALYEKYNHE